jgi:hypothetical protein
MISYDADPIDVTMTVQDALDRSALIPDDSDVLADSEGISVTLTGHVSTWAEHDAAGRRGKGKNHYLRSAGGCVACRTSRMRSTWLCTPSLA